MIKLFITLILVGVLLLEGQLEMPVLPGERLLLTLMVVGEVTGEVLSLEKTQQRLIDQELMLLDGLLKV